MADDANSQKVVRWLRQIDDALEKREYWNVSRSLSYLTSAGTILEDENAVYVAEFLEWIVSNLSSALRYKGPKEGPKEDRPEVSESIQIVHDAISAGINAIENPEEAKAIHETFKKLRYRASRLQLTKLNELEFGTRSEGLLRRLQE